MTRNEIIQPGKLTSGGWLTEVLNKLTESGFIKPYIPFDKTAKDSIYKLTDEYSRFYLKFIENNRSERKGTWTTLSRETAWKSWSGNAFEGICLRQINQIKKELGIEGVETEVSGWRYKPKPEERDKNRPAETQIFVVCFCHCQSLTETLTNSQPRQAARHAKLWAAGGLHLLK